MQPVGRKALADRFLARYGHAMAEWASIEFALSRWFVYVCDPSWTQPALHAAVFYSARSFHGRHDMLARAFRAASRDPALTAFFRPAMKRTFDYYSFRNRLAHQLPLYLDTEQRMILHRGELGVKFAAGIGERDLVIARRNFHRLFLIWRGTLPNLLPKPLLSPEEGLRRIASLSPVPNSLRPGRTRTDRS